MALAIRSLHAASDPALLNEEWIVIENTGTGPVSSLGWSVGVARQKGQRPSLLGTLQPGFVLQAGEKIRLVTGTASKKAQGVSLPSSTAARPLRPCECITIRSQCCASACLRIASQG